MGKLFDDLKKEMQEEKYLSQAYGTLYWDLETSMPKGGLEDRSDTLAYIATEILKKQTSDERMKLLKDLTESEEFKALSKPWQKTVKFMLDEALRDKNIPPEFMNEFIKAQAICGSAWQDAKQASDFSIYAPHLEKMIEYTKKKAKYKYPERDAYETLLDMHEEGMDSATIDRLFNDLKKDLVPFIEKIVACEKPENPKFKNLKIEKAHQEAVQKYLLDYIGFSFDKGSVGETEHPFTLNISCNDVRISNHFREEDAFDFMFSAIHEGGHAIFEQNVDPEYDGTPAGSCRFMGIHESQSRFYENVLGRNINFWKPIYSDIQKLMPEIADITLDEFYHEINHVKNSFIRTMADEVTYGLHIILRYEVEKEIFMKGASVKDLPALWNKKMEDYLHLTPKNDAEGILQDMHWSDGSFGYFPSYLLGSIYDGMYLDALTRELGDVDTILKEGRIKEITRWLNEKIHQHGSTKSPKEVIENVCGKEVSAEPLMRYFKNKYTGLYKMEM
jgi:carboxypeptidase Taq